MLSIEGLAKQYQSSACFALRDINLTFTKGEFVALLGSSGAGKSTLIRCINRLIEPTYGTIHWGDENITNYDKRQLRQFRQQVGMIFQNFNLIDRMSVLRNVLVGRFGSLKLAQILTGRISKDEVEEARKALETVGMAAFADRRVSELSGGQRQRVAIARALVQHPQLILGDEPVASLDPVTAKKVMELLKDICLRDSLTMIINLHSVELAKMYATRVLGLAKGTVVFDGTPEELTEQVLQKIYVPDGDRLEPPLLSAVNL